MLVDQMEVDAVDLSEEVRDRVHHPLLRTPVVLVHPVGTQVAQKRDRRAVAPVTGSRRLGQRVPAVGGNALPDPLEDLLRDVDTEAPWP